MNTFPSSTVEQREDLKERLDGAIVEWLEAEKMAGGSVAGRFSIYDAVKAAVDAEYEKAQPTKAN